MTTDAQSAGQPEFKDRKTGLVVFGILEIGLGAVCALLLPLMIFGMLMSSAAGNGAAPPMNAGMIVPGLVMYGLLAVWFIWMGIGSIKARRWARALLLVSSWMWLVCGVTGLAFMVLFLPDMFAQMAKSGQMPPEVVTIAKVAALGFMTVAYVILPGALVLFYGSRHVKATCERRDATVRWTDRCPLPVLAVSLLSGFWAACLWFMGFYGWAFPFFGVILTGAAGVAVVLIGSGLLAYVAWGAYRLQLRAWWCAAALIVVWGASAAITFSRVDLMTFYEKMNFPAQQLEMMRQMAVPWGSWIAVLSGSWIVVGLAYLVYVKRFFKQPGAPLQERV